MVAQYVSRGTSKVEVAGSICDHSAVMQRP